MPLRRLLIALAALLVLVLVGTAVNVRHAASGMMDTRRIPDPGCGYHGPHFPVRGSPEYYAFRMVMGSASSMGAAWLPMRLGITATPERFDYFVARLNVALCRGRMQRFDADANALRSVDSLLSFLRDAASAVESTRLRTGLIVISDITAAPPHMRLALARLFKSGALRGEVPVDLRRAPMRFVFVLRVPPGVDHAIDARVWHVLSDHVPF